MKFGLPFYWITLLIVVTYFPSTAQVEYDNNGRTASANNATALDLTNFTVPA